MHQLEYRGSTGTIVVDGDDLVVRHHRLARTANGLAAENRIPLSRISGAVLHDATRFVNGRLTVVLDRNDPPRLTIGTAAGHPETVLFRWGQREVFSQLHEWLTQVATLNRRLPVNGGPSGNGGPALPDVPEAGGSEPAVLRPERAAADEPAVLPPDQVFPAEPAVLMSWNPPDAWPSDRSGCWDDDRWLHDADVPRTRLSHRFWVVTGPAEAATSAAGPGPELPPEWAAAGEAPSMKHARRWRSSTLSGRMWLLNELEVVLARLRSEPSGWEEQDRTRGRRGGRLGDRRRDRQAALLRRQQWEQLKEATFAARDWLLHAVATDTPPTSDYYAWLDIFDDRLEEKLAAELADGAPRAAKGALAPSARLAAPLGQAGPGDWQAAERLAAAALQQFGYSRARCTPPGADEGVDVLGPDIAAQVKYTATAVGRPTLQQLQGAAGGRTTAFFSRSGYTSTAFTYAESVGMALFDIDLPNRVTAVNHVAQLMVRS